MSALDERRAAADAAAAELLRCRREWNALCRQHGGAKKTIALAWGRDEALAKSIRAVRWPLLAAEDAAKKANAAEKEAMEQEAAHV